MKILFLHPNFPGQFKHLCTASSKKGYQVKFLCQTHFGREIKGVERLKLKGANSHEELNKVATLVEKSAKMAEQYRAGFLSLKKSGWDPDIVISHSGWGCGFFVKEIWPKTHHVSYLEWWFNPESSFFWYDTANKELNINESSIKKHWIRNQFVAHELASSNAIVSPTSWQRKQLPEIFRKNCHVIFDGIDLTRFRSDSKNRKTSALLTYGTRGMDPIRGFPQFVRSLPHLIKSSNIQIEVEIAGNDGAFYGSTPEGFKNWRDWAKDFAKEKGISENIKWVGFLEGKSYVKWLQSSWCHVYLTHPFIASWSLVEALATGVPIVASDVETVRDICDGYEMVKYVDHRDSLNIATACASTIQAYSKGGFREHNRNLRCFSIDTSLERWEAVTGLDLTTVR